MLGLFESCELGVLFSFCVPGSERVRLPEVVGLAFTLQHGLWKAYRQVQRPGTLPHPTATSDFCDPAT